jgi:Trp operon repressor
LCLVDVRAEVQALLRRAEIVVRLAGARSQAQGQVQQQLSAGHVDVTFGRTLMSTD